MTLPATGAVLAGGLSLRFGSDKALAPWAEGRLIESATDRLLDAFSSVLVLAKEPERYGFLSRPRLDVVRDSIAETCPLAGVYSALEQARTERVFVCGCDMPYLRRELIQRLWEESQGYEAAVPVWNGLLQPLFAFYSKSCVDMIRNMLPKKRAPRELFDLVRTRRLSEEEVRSVDPEGLSFVDLDTQRDYDRARRRHADGRVRA